MVESSPRRARGAKLVLLVEDEPILRASMVRALARLPGVEVEDAASVRDGLLLLRAEPPDLLITDLDLPDGSGVEIIGRAGGAPTIVVSAYVGRYRQALRSLPHVQVREKPLPLAELCALAQELLGPLAPRNRMPFTAADFLQLACMGRHSVVIAIAAGDVRVGRIVIRGGEVWSASDPEGSGRGALGRLLFRADAEVTVGGIGEDEVGSRDVDGPWEALLLEAARVHDEQAARPAPPPAPAGPQLPAIPPPPARATNRSTTAPPLRPEPSATFDGMLERAVEALLRRRLADAYELFAAAGALRPDDARVRANLERLTVLGYGSQP